MNDDFIEHTPVLPQGGNFKAVKSVMKIDILIDSPANKNDMNS